MVRSSEPKYDKFKHSHAATKKGGFGKSGKGGWGDAIDDIKGFEGASAAAVLGEDEVQTQEKSRKKEKEPVCTDYELEVWNITRGKQKQVAAMFETFPGFLGVVRSFGQRRLEMAAYFDSIENAEKALVLNNTKVGKRYLGVRFSKKLSDIVAAQEKPKGAGAEK